MRAISEARFSLEYPEWRVRVGKDVKPIATYLNEFGEGVLLFEGPASMIPEQEERSVHPIPVLTGSNYLMDGMQFVGVLQRGSVTYAVYWR